MPASTEPLIDKDHPLLNSEFQWLYVIGRLKTDAQLARVQSEVTLELQQWLGAQPGLTAEDRFKLSSEHIVLAPAGTGV